MASQPSKPRLDPLDPPRQRSKEAKEWGSKARKAEARGTRRAWQAKVRIGVKTAYIPDCSEIETDE